MRFYFLKFIHFEEDNGCISMVNWNPVGIFCSDTDIKLLKIKRRLQ